MRGVRIAAFGLALVLTCVAVSRVFSAGPMPYYDPADTLDEDGPVPEVPPPPPLPEHPRPVRQVAPVPVSMPAAPVRIEEEMPASPPLRPIIVDASTGREIGNTLTDNRAVLAPNPEAKVGDDGVVKPATLTKPTAMLTPGSEAEPASLSAQWLREWKRPSLPARRSSGLPRTQRAAAGQTSEWRRR